MDEYPKCPVRDKTNTEESPLPLIFHSTTTTATLAYRTFIFLAGYLCLWSKAQEASVKIFNCSVWKYTQGQSEAVPCENGFIGLG